MRVFKAQLKGDLADGLGSLKNFSICKVNDFGNTAILVGKVVFDIEMNGKYMSYQMAFMEEYLKRNNSQKLISRQLKTC
ncbi:hypothetical protein [Lacihabitans sp. CCS-44]|uniref:hypothetical protein n=1 Tax=Lacihabitans sp. CCS-44 TaxID=2487331 RepID=UPI0020CB79BE|nr:hypothetical protein [Lacihabitans sp. CCS-44]